MIKERGNISYWQNSKQKSTTQTWFLFLPRLLHYVLPLRPHHCLPMFSWWVLLTSWHHFWGRWLTILVFWGVTSQPSSRFITCHSCVTWSLTQEDWVPRRPSSRNTNLSRFADTPGSRMLWNFSKKHLFSGGHWLWFSLLGKCRNPETEAAENAAESQNVGKLSCSNNNFWPVWW